MATTSGVLYDQVEVNGQHSNLLYDDLGGVEPPGSPPATSSTGSTAPTRRCRELHGDNAVIEEQFAKAHHLGIGDSFNVLTPVRRPATLKAIGEYRDPTLLQGLMVDRRTLESISTARTRSSSWSPPSPAPTRTPSRAGSRPACSASRSPRSTSQQGLKDQVTKQTDQIVYLLYALLAMSVVISLFGIANSLFLSIHERTREFGLLRAIGATRRQVRRMVRYESAITAAIGGVLGIAVGLLFGALMTASLSELGLVFRVPVGQLIVFFVLAVVVGIIGAVLPARRGARIDVMQAVHYE